MSQERNFKEMFQKEDRTLQNTSLNIFTPLETNNFSSRVLKLQTLLLRHHKRGYDLPQ